MCINPKVLYYNSFLKSKKFSGTLILERTDENVNYCKDLVKTFGGKACFIQCGKCIECLNKRSLEWSIRLACEFETNKNKCYFITLTYDEIHNKNNLSRSDIVGFFRRLYNRGFHFAYYLAGEYGSSTLRPHYHLIIWLDKSLDDLVKYDDKLFTSKFLDDIWSFGSCKVGFADIGSIFYTAGYVNKKLGKKNTFGLVPEFQRFSKGIGLDYFNQHYQSIIDNDEIYINGKAYGLPRYFSKLIQKKDNKLYKLLSDKRFHADFNDFNISGKSDRSLHLSYLQKKDFLESISKFKKQRDFK